MQQREPSDFIIDTCIYCGLISFVGEVAGAMDSPVMNLLTRAVSEKCQCLNAFNSSMKLCILWMCTSGSIDLAFASLTISEVISACSA